MSDLTPDPIDKAYVEAEAMLSDEAARAARRARVLGAVAQAPPAARAARPQQWGRGGWLVAAGVAGLAVVIVSQLYRPITPPVGRPATVSVKLVPATNAAGEPASSAPAEVVAPPKAVPLLARPEPASVPAPVVVASPAQSVPAMAPPAPVASEAPPMLRAGPSPQPAPPPPPAPPSAAADQAASPTAGVAKGAASSPQEVVVVAQKRVQSTQKVPVAVGAFTSSQRDAAAARSSDENLAAAPAAGVVDPGARLRAAAAAGRTSEVKALLKQGAAVNAPDADGDTALMKSIRGDHPAAARLLLQHGASLDQTNRAGESARDMAKAVGDAKLAQALGLSP